MFIIMFTYGTKNYFKDRKFEITHNEYGCSHSLKIGYKSYCINNCYHNQHGYSVIYSDGFKEYWLNNRELDYIEWNIRRELM